MTKSRTKSDLKKAFFDVLKSEFVIELKPKSKPIIVVEGTLDSRIMSKIRLPHGIDIQSIEKLINDTTYDRLERKKMDSAKVLVKDVVEKLKEFGFQNVIGIQDTDLDSLLIWYKNGKFMPKRLSEDLLQTYPSRDAETLLYSQLQKSSKFTSAFPERLHDCIARSIFLATIGVSLDIFNKKEKMNPRIGMKKFSSENRKDPDNYFWMCESVDRLLMEFMKFNSLQLSDEHRNQLSSEVYDLNQRFTESNLEWSHIIRGHDLESLLIRFNKMGVRQHWKIGKIKDKLHDKLIHLTDYDSLKSHEMFESIEKWRCDRNLEPFFA